MKILALESSCDETAAAVVSDGRKVLSSVTATQVSEHIPYGGVVPEIASRRHIEDISMVTEQALKEAALEPEEVDAVAVTAAPGLIGALLVGLSFAKGFALRYEKPLVPVHHLRSHIAANYLSFPELEPPFLALTVSGGHTLLSQVLGYTEFKVLGETRDDAAGEALDKAARILGLPYPGGKNLDTASKGGDPKAFILPRPSVEESPLDFSFSGLKSFVINKVHNLKQSGEEIPLKDLGASVISAVIDCLERNTFAAAEELHFKKLVISGGVAANSVLRSRFEKACAERGIKLYIPPLSLCGDNAAMVGAQAYYEFLSGVKAPLSLNARAAMSIDEAF